MQLDSHAEEGFVLDCSCGEKMLTFGRVEDWLPLNLIFSCNCGEKLTFSEDAKAEYYSSLQAS